MAAALLCSVANLAPAETVRAETVYVRAGHLVDPEKGLVEGARMLRVEDGRIAAITSDGTVPAGVSGL